MAWDISVIRKLFLPLWTAAAPINNIFQDNLGKLTNTGKINLPFWILIKYVHCTVVECTFSQSWRVDECSVVVIVRQEPLASSHDVRHKVIAMDLDERRKLLITVGRDRVVKVHLVNCWWQKFSCVIHSFIHQGRRLAVGSLSTSFQPTASAEA